MVHVLVFGMTFPAKLLLPLLTFSQWKMPYSKKFFGDNTLNSEPIFKIIAALFTTFGMQNGDMVIFSSICLSELLKIKK